MWYDSETGKDVKWHFSLPFGIEFTEENLTHIAEAIEAGEIEPGAVTINCPLAFAEKLPPALLKRLDSVLRVSVKLRNY